MPFYKKLEGQPSNSLHIQTLEDVPSAPPTNIRSEMINKTSASLSWAPPPPQHRNGILKGEVYFELIGLPYSRRSLLERVMHFFFQNIRYFMVWGDASFKGYT